MEEGKERKPSRAWYLLLVLPFVGLLVTPIYAREGPLLWGIPFFYWYQFAWTPVAAGLTFVVHKKLKR